MTRIIAVALLASAANASRVKFVPLAHPAPIARPVAGLPPAAAAPTVASTLAGSSAYGAPVSVEAVLQSSAQHASSALPSARIERSMTKRQAADNDAGFERWSDFGLYSKEETPLQAFLSASVEEVVADLDTDGDGQLSSRDLDGFTRVFVETMARDARDSEEVPKITSEELIQKAITGDPSATSVSCESFAKWLEEFKKDLPRSVPWDAFVDALKYDQKTSTTLGWLSSKIKAKYRRVRYAIQGREFLMQVDEERLAEKRAAALARAQILEAKAKARTMPERATDLEVEVENHITRRFGTAGLKVPISTGDTIDDVFSRYLLAIADSMPNASPEDREALFAGEHQPSWLIVQKGSSTSKKGYVVKNLGLSVADLKLTSDDILHFATPYLKSVEVFFRTYEIKDALDSPP